MNLLVDSFLITSGLVLLLGFGTFSVISIQEKEPRAARISLITGCVLAGGNFLSLLLPMPIRGTLAALESAGLITLLVVAVLPARKALEAANDQRTTRFDERDVVFSRARLSPGSGEHKAYYQMRPENLELDDRFRRLPGLLSPQAKKAETFIFQTADACFELTQFVATAVDGPIASQQHPVDPAKLTEYLKGLTLHLGAHSVGVTELRGEHVYSNIGRGTGVYGDPIELTHHYAIAFSVEMDYGVMGQAPEAPVVMESARKYVDGAVIAIILANFCRRLGYASRAHIDGNYRVIAPLVARDAGLGEIGRMGILMTPRLGPRVRLGVVTTDLPLLPDQSEGEPSMIDFCMSCLKCAENCPSKAIAFGGREGEPGSKRWKLDENKCFHYWNIIGTDCGVCMAVCPYSHPDNWAHNSVRHLARRSSLFRSAAIWLDDLFYGRHPALRVQAGWLPNGKDPKADRT